MPQRVPCLFALLLVAALPVSGQQAATFVYPVNGQQNVDTSKPFQWTAPAGATRYQLYIGRALGGSDLANSSQIQTTSYTVPALPLGVTLYARIWSNNGTPTTWIYQDITFTAAGGVTAGGPAQFIYPLNGQQSVDTSKPFQWTAPAGATVYQLYVGSTLGGSNLVNSNQIQTTSYTVTALPAGVTLYARIWTNNGTPTTWISQDITFTAAGGLTARGPPQFTYPVNGQQNVDTTKPFQWTAPAGATVYQLYVGSTLGGSNLVNSNQIQTTSYTVPALLVGVTLYARIWSNNGTPTTWIYQDITFTAAAGTGAGGTAAILYPPTGAVNVDTSLPFQWQSLPNVQAYRLTVGTVQGGSDLADSGNTLQTSFNLTTLLPVGSIIYARVGTNVAGLWSYSDSSFAAAARFAYPAVRSIGVDTAAPFQWSPGVTFNGIAATYRLVLGTTPGGNDLFDSGVLLQAVSPVPTAALPVGSTLYARATVLPGNGGELLADTVFIAAGTPVPTAQMLYPVPGAIDVDVSNPFQWTETPMATAYELKLFAGGTQVLDTGEINIPRYFAEALTLGSYTAQLGSKFNGQWNWVPFTFAVIHNGASMATEVAHAFWAVDFVRRGADASNFAYPWADLWGRIIGNTTGVSCSTYRDSLLFMLPQMNVAGRLPSTQQPRRLDIGFDNYDVHTLVELFNTDTQAWIVLDPTFDIVSTRSSDGGWAAKEDIQQSALTKNWTSIVYQANGSTFGESIPQHYYLDYPLLFLDLGAISPGGGNDPTPYIQVLSVLPANQWGVYLAHCPGTTTLLVDSVLEVFSCVAAGSISPLFLASTIQLPQGTSPSVQIERPLVYVFTQYWGNSTNTISGIPGNQVICDFNGHCSSAPPR